MNNNFGDLLRKWRKQRRYSQLQLATELDISSKHISFLETGRSAPSREMILKIATFLYLPKREINNALLMAGYAPAYTELSDTDTDLAPVFYAIDQMITNHMPYPAIVLNQNWDVINTNQSAQDLLQELGFSGSANLVEALIADHSETSKIVNWHESVSMLLTRLRYEISLLAGSSRLKELEKKLSTHLSPHNEIPDLDTNQVVVSTQLRVDDDVLSFFSIVAQLGTVQDVAISEFKVELMFPSDDKTKEYYKKG